MLRSDLTRIARKAPELAHAALKQTADDILDLAKQLAPVDTGALRGSGRTEMRGENTAVIGFGSPEIDYAKYQEYGTSRMAAQPYLTPAFAQARQTFERRLREKMKELE